MRKIYWWTNKTNNTSFWSTNYDMLLHWLNSGVNFKLDIEQVNEHFIFKKNTRYYINEDEDIMVDPYDCNLLDNKGWVRTNWVGGASWLFTHTNFLEKAIFTKLTDEEFEAYDD